MKWLERQGHEVTRDQVRYLIDKMGLQAIYPKPNTSAPDKAHAIYPYLLRDKLARLIKFGVPTSPTFRYLALMYI